MFHGLRLVSVESIWILFRKRISGTEERSKRQGERVRPRRRLRGRRIGLDKEKRKEKREGQTVSNGSKLEVKGIWQPRIAYEMILTFYYCKVSFLKRNFKCYPAVREHKNL